MRLLLDMGLSPHTAAHLRQHGHDAVHLRDEGLSQLSDERIVAKAFQERRVIATFDLDFSRMTALQRAAQPSVILFRLEHFTTDQINQMLISLLHSCKDDLEQGAIVVVDPGQVRVRRLPIW